MMLRVKNGNLEPRYFAVNGMDSPGWVKKDLKIDDMRGKMDHNYISRKYDQGST